MTGLCYAKQNVFFSQLYLKEFHEKTLDIEAKFNLQSNVHIYSISAHLRCFQMLFLEWVAC